MLQLMGSERVGYDLVAEQQHKKGEKSRVLLDLFSTFFRCPSGDMQAVEHGSLEFREKSCRKIEIENLLTY